MKNKWLFPAISLLAGIIIGGAAITGAFSKRIFASTAAAGTVPMLLQQPPAKYTRVPFDTAHRHALKYLEQGRFISCTPFKSFLVSPDALAVMNLLLQGTPTLTGFRVVMGATGTSGETAIIVGIKADGTQDKANIYEMNRTGSGPCPIVCDAQEQNPIGGR